MTTRIPVSSSRLVVLVLLVATTIAALSSSWVEDHQQHSYSCLVEARKSNPRSSVSHRSPPRSTTGSAAARKKGGAPPVSPRRRAPAYDDEEEDDEYLEDEEEEDEEELEEEDEYLDDDIDDDEDEDEYVRPSSRKSSRPRDPRRSSRSAGRGGPPPRSNSSRRGPPPRSAGGRRGPPPKRGRGPPPRSSGGRRGGGRAAPVVPYYSRGPSAVEGFLTGIRSTLPDPKDVATMAGSTLKAARQSTSSLSANLYREVKGLTSSELEQVLLKATRPDDAPVKGKHVERLVGVTWQLNKSYDLYDAVLRKLWSKMAEKDWRTTIKALYILHRYSQDGGPDHAPKLKARLRELRRTKDPKRKVKYFDSKLLLAGDANPDTVGYRAFVSRYSKYVLLRAQCFGGMFTEIAQEPKPDRRRKQAPKAITSTALRAEHLDACSMVMKAGMACQLRDESEICENTAICCERAAADMIGLTGAVATALNRVLKDEDLEGADPALLKKWCQLYSEELLPQTRAMVKKTAPKLDPFGLYLPSRMPATVRPELLEIGLALDESSKTTASAGADTTTGADDSGVQTEGQKAAADEDDEEEESTKEDAGEKGPIKAQDAEEEEGGELEEDEYEYEDESDYYDAEDEDV